MRIAAVWQSHTKGIVKVLKVGTGSGRVCMYPKDVQRIMGKEYTQARLYLIRIKKHLKKEDHQYISVEEFCKYTGLPVDEVLRSML